MSNEEVKGNLENEIKAVVTERDSSYGGFNNVADISQKLKEIMRSNAGWNNLLPCEQEGLEMIMHKISRILSSRISSKYDIAKNFERIKDSYIDISGYSKVTLKSLDEIINIEA